MASSSSYLPGTASLLEELDKRLMVLLRDGRTLIGSVALSLGHTVQAHFGMAPFNLLTGYLRSVDQFANLVLHRCIERIHVGDKYGDIPRGVFVVRGENVVLLGEVDDDRTVENAPKLKEVGLEEILEAQSRQQAEKEEQDKLRQRIFKERGLAYTSEVAMEDNY